MQYLCLIYEDEKLGMSMDEKAQKDLVDAYMRRQLGRRELIRRMGQLGVGAVAANTLPS